MNKLTEVLQAIRDANPETNCGGCSESCLDGEGNIIGHPLHIGHLLKALANSRKLYCIDTAGIFGQHTNEGKQMKLNLTQDLEQQLQSNPELVDTLYELLVSK